tara:strand:- start:8 stop:703 length:696 start_codon:yes stop_codon:yes gene_type:complete
MKELHVSEKGIVMDILRVFNSEKPVIMFQLPSVYTLFAPPTKAGAAALNEVKQRLPGKNYGTAIGGLESFCSMAMEKSLPSELNNPEALKLLTGAFIKINIAPVDFNSVFVRNGTHQGLLLDSPHRDLFMAIEEGLDLSAEPKLFYGNHYAAPLCTSANLSGDPLGSITDWERAYRFAKDRGVAIIIRSEKANGAPGSYPIFHLTPEKVSIKRSGPGEEEIKNKLPQNLFD